MIEDTKAGPMMVRLLNTEGGYEKLLALLKPKEHRILPIPSLPTILRQLLEPDGEARVYDLFRRRDEAIVRERNDPYRYGVRLEPWSRGDALLKQAVLLAIFGGNRSSKTEYGAFKGVEALVVKPGSRVLWLSESELSSVEIQQQAVHRYIPPEWRNVRKGKIANVNWSSKGGFTDKKFVLPNGSGGIFGSYKQDIGDYEGMEFDLVVADEDLPLYWLRTLLVRVATRMGNFIWTFTPVKGITPAVKEVVEGATTIETRPAALLDSARIHVEGCPAGHMPYVQKPLFPNAMVLYFHSVMNPYGGYEGILKTVNMGSAVEVERRFYGYARNTIKALFPGFSSANVIDQSRIPADVSRYHIADPAGARNMFMIWVAVDAQGRHFIYREWPDVLTFGEWALPSEDARKWDGTPGPAQPTLGFGVREYKRMILEAEGNKLNGGWELTGEEIESRHIDPRSGAAQSIAEETGSSTLIDRFQEETRNQRGEIDGPMMDFLPAPGLREEQGIMAINDLLSYRRDEPLTALINEPKLFVAGTCENVIWALKNYTGNDGERAACKDPIDCLRYMATAALIYLDAKRARSQGGGSY